MPTMALPDDELAAVTAAIRRLIEDDKYLRPTPGSAARGAGEARRGVKANPRTEGRPTANQSRQAGAVRQANRLMAWSTSGRLIFAPFGQHIAPHGDAIVVRFQAAPAAA